MKHLMTRFTYKNILHNKARGLLLIVCIMLVCVMLFVSFLVPTILENNQLNAKNVIYGKTDILISVKDANLSSFNDFTKITQDINEKCNNIVPMFTLLGQYSLKNSPLSGSSFNIISGDFLKVQEINEIKFIGNGIENLSVGGVIISSIIAEKFDLSVGQSLPLKIDVLPMSFKIVGIADTKGLFQNNLSYTVFINRDALTALVPSKDLFNFCAIDVKDEFDVKAVAKDVREIYENFSVEETYSNEQTENALNQGVIPFYLCAVIVCMFSIMIIMSTMTLVFTERTKQFATLKSLGAREGKVFLSMLCESLFYCIVGCILSSLISFIAIMLFSIKLPYLFLNIKLIIYVLPCLISIAITLISTIFPSITSLKKSIRGSMVKKAPPPIRAAIFTIIIFVAFLGCMFVNIFMPLGVMSIGTIFSSLGGVLCCLYLLPTIVRGVNYIFIKILGRKTNFGIFYTKNSILGKSNMAKLRSLSFVMFILMFISMIINTTNYVSSNVLPNTFGDMKISGFLHKESEMLSQVQNDDRILDYVFVNLKQDGIVKAEKKSKLFYDFYGMEVAAFDKILGNQLTNREQAIEKLNDESQNFIVMNSSYKYMLNIEIGDKIEVMFDKVEKTTYDMIVAGFIESKESLTFNIYMNINNMNKILDVKNGNTVFITIDDNDKKGVFESLNFNFSAMCLDFDDMQATSDASFQTVKSTFYIYFILVLIICVMNYAISEVFANSTLLKKHKILSSLGIMDGRLSFIILIQNLLYTLFATLGAAAMLAMVNNQITNIVVAFGIYVQPNTSVFSVSMIIIFFFVMVPVVTYFVTQNHIKRQVVKEVYKIEDTF